MMRCILFLCLLGLSAPLFANCDDSDRLIDQRSEVDKNTDVEKGRLRCVEFVLAVTDRGEDYGWVAWHHVRSDQAIQSHRLGLFPAGDARAMAFGRIPENLGTPDSATVITVLLPSHRWWLVNLTRHGWQLRSGTIGQPNIKTLRKLVADVAHNAAIADEL